MRTNELPRFIQTVLSARRKARAKNILAKVTTAANMRVIDIGCGVDSRSFDAYVPREWEIIGVDLHSAERVKHEHPNFKYLQQDAQDLNQFKTKEFDLAVSIGMLEHITDEETFRNIVSEIRRVAKQYVVVVPYRYCWIEPHYGVPFFPLLPYSLQIALVKALNLSNQREAVTLDREYVRKHYRWLSNAQYQKEFPDASISILPTLETIAITRKAAI